MAIATLKKRPEFLRIRGGRRWSGRSFLIECKPRSAINPSSETARFGFTVTKKLGNAVVRNRIRRRLKSAAAMLAPEFAEPTCDYVIVARRSALDCEFQDLCRDMRSALEKLAMSEENGGHGNARRHRRRPKRS